MREVDQALARAYARRGAVAEPGPAPGASAEPIPAAPHVRGADPAHEGPAPHFAVPPAPDLRGTPAALRWPETVRALEREHGDRFERFADALVAARDRQQVRVLLFTSCHRAEGRTTLVLTLSRFLARRPGRTLLVDADLTGPMLARQLGLRPRAGLGDVVEDGLALAEALIDAPDDHLSLLPLRGPVARPRDFLAGAGWACLMARLRREFDLVL